MIMTYIELWMRKKNYDYSYELRSPEYKEILRAHYDRSPDFKICLRRLRQSDMYNIKLFI